MLRGGQVDRMVLAVNLELLVLKKTHLKIGNPEKKLNHSLREFPLNSRHPGPRREEGGSRAAGHMPLWLDPLENSGRPDSMRRRVQIDTFARNWASNFRQI